MWHVHRRAIQQLLQLMPDEAESERFFHLSENGYEKEIKQHMKKIGADKEEW